MSIAHVVEQYRYPRYAWGWKGALLVLGLVVAPQAAAVLLVPGLRSLELAAAVAGLVFYPVVFVSGVFLYLHWRLTCLPSSYWLTVGLSLVSVHGLVLSVLQMINADGFLLRPIWLIGSDVAVGLALLAMVQVAERYTPSVDPATVGLVLALGVAGIEIVSSNPAAELPRATTAEVPAMILLVLIGLLLAPAVHQLTTLPAWGRDRLGLAALILSLHRVVAHPAGPDGPLRDAIALGTGLAGSVLLCGTTLALLRAAIHDDRLAIRQLQDLLAVTETEARRDRDRLHQIRSAVAGISSANALLEADRAHRRIPVLQMHLLQDLMDSETARLHRLAQDRSSPADNVALDNVLGPLVAAQQLLGRRVRWSPSGHRIRASKDRISEVVQTLLDNAGTHAAGAPVDIEVRRAGPAVEVVVADGGPGVAPEVQLSIFERGVRRPGSSGEGIGLHVAQRLMDDCGSTLRLDSSRDRGAAFVLRLPAAPGEDDPL